MSKQGNSRERMAPRLKTVLRSRAARMAAVGLGAALAGGGVAAVPVLAASGSAPASPALRAATGQTEVGYLPDDTSTAVTFDDATPLALGDFRHVECGRTHALRLLQ